MDFDTEQPIILVVEDDGLLRGEIVDALRLSGWRVLETHSGEAAVALIGSDARIRMLVTDIQLGGRLTGWDVADIARNANPGMQVVYTSGNPVNEARRVPRGLFFAKPYSVAEIVAACLPTLTGPS